VVIEHGLGKTQNLEDPNHPRLRGKLMKSVVRPLSDPLGPAWKHGKEKCWAAVKWFTRARLRRGLLHCESCIALPFFLLSWIVCTALFGIAAGYRMAKTQDGKKKLTVLENMPLFGKPKP
jgi:hypothetical protein